LHEELIDDGIAKIYEAHLNVAVKLAEEQGVAVTTTLLAGKPWQAIRKYLEKSGASLLMVGKTGVHSDAGLDIGSNAENLLRTAPCHVWISQAEAVPPSDLVAAETILWSEEAEATINRAPDFVRSMARTAVIRAAQEAGHTFITSRFVNEIMHKMMPGGDRSAMGGEPRQVGFEPLEWADDAHGLLMAVKDESVRESLRLRAEKSARRDAADQVETAHIAPFLEESRPLASTSPVAKTAEITWSAASLARLMRLPESIRDQVRAAVEAFARNHGASHIEGEMEDLAFGELRKAMCPKEADED